MQNLPTTTLNKVIALISTGHFFSHFYMLLLPPLFPLMHDEFAVSYTQLGFAITVYSLTTALTQVPAGFLVDRYGARWILMAGLIAESIAILLIGLNPSYTALLWLMVLSGLGNAVFHPCDYTILNATVPTGRIGRAFSIHTFSGLLGAAVAAPLVVFLAVWSHWHTALIICGLAGLMVSVIMVLNSNILGTTVTPQQAVSKPDSTGINTLTHTPIVLALLFFVGLAMVGTAITKFGISALELDGQANLNSATLIITVYIFTAPVGVLIGGWVADRIQRHDLFVSACLSAVAVCTLLVAWLSPSVPILVMLFAIAGLSSGCVAPSRDMMIRALTPAGQSGKVFGFVSTGFNIGGILAPPLFGFILDNGEPALLFLVAGLLSLATILSVCLTGQSSRQRFAAQVNT